jgi:hypothetical protein
MAIETTARVTSCILLTIQFVGSLYLIRNKDRNNPTVIKKRIISTLLSCALGILLVQSFGQVLLGFNLERMAYSAIFGLGTTAILYTGPIIVTLIEAIDFGFNNVFSSTGEGFRNGQVKWMFIRDLIAVQ